MKIVESFLLAFFKVIFSEKQRINVGFVIKKNKTSQI